MPSKKKPKPRRSSTFAVEGGGWVYRHPFIQGGRWRVRRRHLASSRVVTVTLEADPKSVTAARDEVLATANAEEAAAKEAGPTVVSSEDRALTVDLAVDRWGATVTPHLKPSTLQDFESCMAVYKRTLGATRLIAEIGLSELEKIFNEIWKGRAGKTLIKHRAYLVRLWAWAKKHGVVKTNVPELIDIARAWRKDAARGLNETGRPLSVEEARKLLAACKEKRIVAYDRKRFGVDEKIEAKVAPPDDLHDIVCTGLLSGLRRSNVWTKNGLRWNDLDMTEGRETLTIDADRMKGGRRFTAPINAQLVTILRARLKVLGRAPRPNELIFGEASIDPGKSFVSACKRAGLEGVGFHDMRRTFSVWLAPIASYVVHSRLMDHAPSTNLTLRYSKDSKGTHLEDLRDQLNKLPAILPAATAVAVEQA